MRAQQRQGGAALALLSLCLPLMYYKSFRPVCAHARARVCFFFLSGDWVRASRVSESWERKMKSEVWGRKRGGCCSAGAGAAETAGAGAVGAGAAGATAAGARRLH